MREGSKEHFVHYADVLDLHNEVKITSFSFCLCRSPGSHL